MTSRVRHPTWLQPATVSVLLVGRRIAPRLECRTVNQRKWGSSLPTAIWKFCQLCLSHFGYRLLEETLSKYAGVYVRDMGKYVTCCGLSSLRHVSHNKTVNDVTQSLLPSTSHEDTIIIEQKCASSHLISLPARLLLILSRKSIPKLSANQHPRSHGFSCVPATLTTDGNEAT